MTVLRRIASEYIRSYILLAPAEVQRPTCLRREC